VAVAGVTRAARFSQADLTRALKAFEKAGVSVAGGKINPDGSITILTGEPSAANDRLNPLDRVLHR
jgi:hypothetical protein